MSTAILFGFASATVSEAAELRAVNLAQHGRVDELTADLFASIGLSMVAKGGKGASPKGAHAALALLSTGDAPSKKALQGVATSWADVCQGLHSMVTMLAAAGACPAPAALPAWADPVAIAQAKADAAAKRAANKAAKAGAAKGDTDGADADSDGAEPAQSAPTAPSANLIAAAIKAGEYSASELGLIVYALQCAHVIPFETAEA